MRVLVIGADGFVGRHVRELLASTYDVYGAAREKDAAGKNTYVDLLNRETIAKAITEIKPQVIINCAGIIENSDKANLNPIFTGNLLKEALASGLKFERIIISGSASEYGLVEEEDLPVSESKPLNANSIYGRSKAEETTQALEFSKKHGLPVVIARIFNPIGLGMNPRLLIPKIIQQIQEIQQGKRQVIDTISRLDSRRDYIDIKDVALAIKALVDNQPKEDVYNIGSGQGVSNGELVELILENSNLPTKPEITESSPTPEPLVAVQADVSRLKNEFRWSPVNSLRDTIKEIMYAAV